MQFKYVADIGFTLTGMWNQNQECLHTQLTIKGYVEFWIKQVKFNITVQNLTKIQIQTMKLAHDSKFFYGTEGREALGYYLHKVEGIRTL